MTTKQLEERAATTKASYKPYPAAYFKDVVAKNPGHQKKAREAMKLLYVKNISFENFRLPPRTIIHFQSTLRRYKIKYIGEFERIFQPLAFLRTTDSPAFNHDEPRISCVCRVSNSPTPIRPGPISRGSPRTALCLLEPCLQRRWLLESTVAY